MEEREKVTCKILEPGPYCPETGQAQITERIDWSVCCGAMALLSFVAMRANAVRRTAMPSSCSFLESKESKEFEKAKRL